MDRLAEMDEYDSMFGRRLVDDDFLAAGYTPQEVQAYRGSDRSATSLTAQDRAAMEAQYGTLEAPDPRCANAVLPEFRDRLISAGLDPYVAGPYSRRILGDTAPTDGGLALALQTSSPPRCHLRRSGGLSHGNGGIPARRSSADGPGARKPVWNIRRRCASATIGRGIAETASRMDPNTLYSVFGPPGARDHPARSRDWWRR